MTCRSITLLALAITMGSPQLQAADSTNQPAPNAGTSTTDAPLVVVGNRTDSEVGIADSAAQGTIGKDDLEKRPLLRVGELMETVPGMIATEHSGGGKANQYYLRGFDLDHGTDFAVHVDGVPVNLPTHAHGQGYCDLNFVIPEIVQKIDYRKGPYYVEDGDFDSAGAADMHYVDTLPHGIASVTGGTFQYGRMLLADTPAVGSGHLLYAFEAGHDNGPWDSPQDFRHVNGVLRFSTGDRLNGASLGVSAYAASWNATNQMPQRAIDEGLIGIYGNLNPSDGGRSQRYSAWGNWHGGNELSQTNVDVYAVAYRLNLWSDFTFFMNDPVNGDQFEQVDRRYVLGGAITHTWVTNMGGRPMENTIGLQSRNDLIPEVAIYNTADREVIGTVRDDRVNEESIGVFAKNTCSWQPWLRSTVGLRGDAYRFDVNSDNPENSGTKTAAIASPKGTLVFGPWEHTEYYLNAGLGFHSNDARGVVQRVDPTTGAPMQAATPLVRSKGAEIGMRSDVADCLHTTLGFFLLDLNSELHFNGDDGTTAPTGSGSRRVGVEWSNACKPTDWLTFDADVSYTHARFRDDIPAEGGGEGRYIPNSIPLVMTAGTTITFPNHIYTTARLRYLGPRPLNENDTVEEKAAVMVNGRVGYQGHHFDAHIDLLNLLNRKDADEAYYYQSQLRNEAAPVEDVHVHTAEPFSVRGTVTWNF